MNFYYNLFIFYIFFVKLLFALFSSLKIYYEWINKKLEQKTGNTNSQEVKKNQQMISNLDYWKKRFEFVYIMSMSILLLYLFRPYQKKAIVITTETRLLVFLFAIILISTANWGIFFKESPYLIEFQNIIGRNTSQTTNTTSSL